MADRVAIDPSGLASSVAQTGGDAASTAAQTAAEAAGGLSGVAGSAGADPLSAAMTLETGQWSGHTGVVGTTTGANASQLGAAATGTIGELTGTDQQNAGQIAKQA